MPYCYQKQLELDFKAFLKYRKKYRGILQYFARHRSTNFLNKYHKGKKLWSNKLAYLAGLIDGEGYLKIEKHGTIRLIIGMCDRKTIYWIYKNFGGNVKLQKTKKGKKFYVWRLNQGKDLFYLLLLLIPFLIHKKEKLTKALIQLINKFKMLKHTLKHYNWR